jgi:hypothetical protein
MKDLYTYGTDEETEIFLKQVALECEVSVEYLLTVMMARIITELEDKPSARKEMVEFIKGMVDWFKKGGDELEKRT